MRGRRLTNPRGGPGVLGSRVSGPRQRRWQIGSLRNLGGVRQSVKFHTFPYGNSSILAYACGASYIDRVVLLFERSPRAPRRIRWRVPREVTRNKGQSYDYTSKG